jgi:hypothetical protein
MNEGVNKTARCDADANLDVENPVEYEVASVDRLTRSAEVFSFEGCHPRWAMVRSNKKSRDRWHAVMP